MLGFVLLLLGAAPGPTTPVAVQLVLAVDVSGSVDQSRFELQREGYAAAFRSPAVLQAIRSTATGSIAVAVMQWTGPTLHVVAVDWTLIDDDASAVRFADAIAHAPRVLFSGGTSISGAIDYARAMLARSPFAAQRRIIDVSGDGANNRGRPAEDARDEAVAAGVAINGLPILTLEPELDVYYRENVIGGPRAFVIAARSYEEFAQAIRSKLITEIADSDATVASPQTSRFATFSALPTMNSRRGSTTSPISVLNTCAASSMSPTFTCNSVRTDGSSVVFHN
jgi:Protein of unknown function (DUF1194)